MYQALGNLSSELVVDPKIVSQQTLLAEIEGMYHSLLKIAYICRV